MRARTILPVVLLAAIALLSRRLSPLFRVLCNCLNLDSVKDKDRLMDIRPLLVAPAEPTVLVKPGPRPCDRPAGLAEPALVVDRLFRVDRLNSLVA